jgi:hypothetical protein
MKNKKELTMGIFLSFFFVLQNVSWWNRIAGQIELAFRPHSQRVYFSVYMRRRLRTFFSLFLSFHSHIVLLIHAHAFVPIIYLLLHRCPAPLWHAIHSTCMYIYILYSRTKTRQLWFLISLSLSHAFMHCNNRLPHVQLWTFHSFSLAHSPTLCCI